MPQLPSGRRIEFSLDRFHAMLRQMDSGDARSLVVNLSGPDDLLFVMDTVYFGRDDGVPFFAGCVASDWTRYAGDWSTADREALLGWFASNEARARRAEAIEYIKTLVFGRPCMAVAYPYVVVEKLDRQAGVVGSRLLQ